MVRTELALGWTKGLQPGREQVLQGVKVTNHV